MTTKKTKAGHLAEMLLTRGVVPDNWRSGVCMMVGLGTLSASDELVCIDPSTELFRIHKAAKTVQTLRDQAKELSATLNKMGYRACHDGCTVYVTPW